jgi:acyl phosphate:glycerol-3-phosphate acyltransferase
MLVPVLIAAIFGYLLGSLPFGYVVARARGVDIFAVGSRSPGATNVRRMLGSGPGNLVLALDILKGAVAGSWALLHYRPNASASGSFDGAWAMLDFQVRGNGWVVMGLAGLVGAMLGHGFSCFTRFHGGKSVATGAGGFAVVFPAGALVALAVWLLVVALTRYVSVASMAAAASLPFSALFFNPSPVMVTASAGVAGFVVLRHRPNIARLLAGTENKIGRSAAPPKS